MNLETLTSGIVFANAMLFIGIGLIIMAGVIVVINNIFHRYWKPVTFFWPMNEYQLTTPEEHKHEHTKQSRRPKKDPVSIAGNQQQPNQG